LPVKKTSDLMLVMSNLYTLENGSLTMSDDRLYKTPPTVELGDEHFKKVRPCCIIKLFSKTTYATPSHPLPPLY
jgi:UDP-N-acetylglucosamine pyrophosphorylase